MLPETASSTETLPKEELRSPHLRGSKNKYDEPTLFSCRLTTERHGAATRSLGRVQDGDVRLQMRALNLTTKRMAEMTSRGEEMGL